MTAGEFGGGVSLTVSRTQIENGGVDCQQIVHNSPDRVKGYPVGQRNMRQPRWADTAHRCECSTGYQYVQAAPATPRAAVAGVAKVGKLGVGETSVTLGASDIGTDTDTGLG